MHIGEIAADTCRSSRSQVEKVVEGDASTTTKKGNQVTRKGDKEDPAVIIKADSGVSFRLLISALMSNFLDFGRVVSCVF